MNEHNGNSFNGKQIIFPKFVIIDNQQYVCTSSYEILAMLLQYCGCRQVKF